MKKIVGVTLLFLLTLTFSSAHLGASKAIFSNNVWSVPQDFQTIQEAINAASPGDIIFVASGIYRECISIWKPLAIIGEVNNTTIIDGKNLTTTVTISVSNVTLSGFTVRNGKSHGIFINNAAYCTVSNNIITDNREHGIYLLNSPYNIISNNTLQNNKNGGIILHFSPNNKLRNNIITNNTFNFGVFAMKLPSGSLAKHFFEDIDTSNKVEGKSVYYWVNQSSKEVPSDAGYIALINSTNIIVKNISLSKNTHGVLLAFSTNITIENVNCSKNMDGIYLWYSHRNKITKCLVSENSLSGIHLLFSDRNICAYNIVSNNTCQGIFLEDYSKHNIILENIAYANMYGIFLWPSYYTIVKGNCVFNNKYGVCQEGVGSHTIYNNNLLNNTQQVHLRAQYNPPPCKWDNGYLCGGNFWSDYDGIDVNHDGLGDTPYIIDEKNKDNYPLMHPYIPSDINHDSIVNIIDATQLGLSWNTTTGQSNFHPNADLNLDGIINTADADITKNHWQQTTIQFYD